jgi:predicted DNA-binding WGR domain protein
MKGFYAYERPMIHYRWENHLTHRYYRVLLTQDLFGQWLLTKIWGGINQATGRITHFPYQSYEEAIKAIDQIAKIRIKRGYALISRFID